MQSNPKAGAANQPAYEAVSDANGNFSFSGLPAGDYTIQVSKLGFATTQGRVTLGGGQHLEQIVALQVAALMETIRVTEPDPGGTAGAMRLAPAAAGVLERDRGRVQSDGGGRLHHGADKNSRREADLPGGLRWHRHLRDAETRCPHRRRWLRQRGARAVAGAGRSSCLPRRMRFASGSSLRRVSTAFPSR